MEIARMVTSNTNCRISVVVFIIAIICPLISSKQYRTDYVYNRKTDAFYKFHMETVMFHRVQELCALEGASAMVPRSVEDIIQAHGLFKQYPDIGDFAWIGNDGNKHESVEEIPLIRLEDLFTSQDKYLTNPQRDECNVVTRDGDTKRILCPQSLPFICKVDAGDVFQNEQCKIFSRGYRYFESVGSCYKIPELAFQWNEAFAECRAEGAHLVVLNSELEHQVIYNFTNEEHSVKHAKASWFFFAGVRAEKKKDGSPIIFKTIFNQTLEEAGYSQWSENEPNNWKGIEYCVTIFKNDGKYNDINCEDSIGFICEKEV